MSIKDVLLMLLSGSIVEILTFWVLRHWYNEPQSRGVAMWLMLISWWYFLRRLPFNKKVHVGLYVAAALVVSVCAVVLAYYV
ncbi:MAG TPA: hypothetical protein VJ875_00700 [Pyrinomonadaceae bacterium]|nr:hypothetical protein [Pyrinomonadaceae bacterium]